MELISKSLFKTDESTISDISIDGKHLCFILEDKDRGLTQNTSIEQIEKIKVFGLTCIPRGRYEIVITYSNRFKCMMPLLLDVKGWTGVRIHWGNWAKDTEGCLIVGTTVGKNEVEGSKIAYAKVISLLQDACSKGKVYITLN